MKLTYKGGWDFCFIELPFQTQSQSLDEGCSIVGVQQMQTADLQTCPFPINFENNILQPSPFPRHTFAASYP